jgi:chemotaxis protein histidine kinase CheA
MGFQLRSGNRPSLKGGIVEPSCEPMDISIAVVEGGPMKKGFNPDMGEGYMDEGEAGPRNYKAQYGGPYLKKESPYKEEDDNNDENDFNMMNNPPPDPDPDPIGPDPDPDPDPDPGTPDPDPATTDDPPEEDPPAEEDKTEEEKGEEEAEDVKDEVEKSEEAANEEYLDSYMQENLGITSEEIDSMKEVQEGKTETEKIEQSVKSESEKMEEARTDQLKKEAEEQGLQPTAPADADTEMMKELASDTTDIAVGQVKDAVEDKVSEKVLEKPVTKIAQQALKKKMLTKAGAKVAAKVALKFIPGVNMISTGYDVFKLGQSAWRNRDKIASWGRRQSNNMKNKMNEWTG